MQTKTVREATTLLPFLLSAFPHLKRTKIKSLLAHGAVSVRGSVTTKHNDPLRPGDAVCLLSKQASQKEHLKKQLDFPVVYEDEAVIVVEKPAGLLSMGTEKEKIRTLYWQLTDYIRRQNESGRGRIFIVHRLDRDVSGLMVFAKSEKAKEALQKNWKKAVKKYCAVVRGVPLKKQGIIRSFLAEDKFRKVYSAAKRSREAKHAVTHYRVLKAKPGTALLEITLETGRKNQIRVHLADLGHPILGDSKYGDPKTAHLRLALHAHFLSFPHPVTGKSMAFESRLPEGLF